MDDMERSTSTPEMEEQSNHIAEEPNVYSPLYVPKQNEKKNNHLTMVLIIILLIVLVVGLIAAVSRLVQTAMVEMGEDVLNGNTLTSKIEQTLQNWQGEDEEEASDFTVPEEDEPYIPSAEDEYYVRLTDAIGNDLSYTVTKQDYSYTDDEKNLYISISYPEIVGDVVRNKEHINDAIERAATYYLRSYANHPENGEVSNCQIDVTSYVTYMSEDTLSIVLSENLYLMDMGQVDLFCMNIDIQTGQIMDNTQILSYSEDLAKEFRKISNRQNGEADAVSALTDTEIADFLSDSTSGIIFYTPVGLEIGYNYSVDSSSGWITATIKDYQKYIHKM